MIDRIGSTSRVHGYDIHVRLNDRTHGELIAFAGTTGLALNGCVRLLIERGLAAQRDGHLADGADLVRELRSLNQSALANLIGIELVKLLFANLMPRGNHLLETLWEQAASNARMTLYKVEQAIAEEAGC